MGTFARAVPMDLCSNFSLLIQFVIGPLYKMQQLCQYILGTFCFPVEMECQFVLHSV